MLATLETGLHMRVASSRKLVILQSFKLVCDF